MVSTYQSLQHKIKREEAFREELRALLNRYSMEGGSATPDFVLADYLIRSLESYNEAIKRRTQWYRG